MSVLTDRVGIRLRPEEAAELAVLAIANARSLSAEMRIAILAHLAAERQRHAEGADRG